MPDQADPIRCPWVDLTKDDYVRYHDLEWGVPLYDDQTIFEFLILEGAQAGLSWYTVLRKRENYRNLFENFDPVKVAEFDDRKIEELLADPGIIRNRQKVHGAVNNARLFLEIQKEFGEFSRYIWEYVGGKPLVNRVKDMSEFRATSPESDALSQDLRQRGFKFTGSTIIYAHMQATGMVNDHTLDCFRRQGIIDGYRGH